MYQTPLRPTGSPEPNSRRRSPSRRHRSPRPRSKSGSSERPRRSRSHSPGRPRRSRSRSPSRPRRSKSRSPSRPRRSKSRSPVRSRRSKSRSPVRSRRSKSRSPVRPRRSRSRSPGRKRRSRSRSPGRKRRSRSRSSGRKRRSRSRSSGRKRCSRSRSSGRPRRSRSSSPGRPRRSRSSSPGRPRRSRSSSPGRPRRSRSRLPRSRPRRSPPTSVRRRSSSSSPEDVNSRSQDDKDSSRYSPSFPTVSASESSRASKSSWGDPDRSAAARRSEDIPGKFQSDSDRAHKTVPSSREGVKELKQPPEELKPKSILKKRPEPDPSIPPTQIDSYLSSIPRYTTALPTSSQFPTLGMPSVLESSKSPVRSGNLISVTTGDGTSNLTQVTRPQAATPGNYNTITSVVLSDNIGNKQSPAMPVSNKTTGTTAENRSNLLTVQVSGNTTTSTKLGECVPNSNVTPVNNVTPLPQDSLGNKDFTLYSQNEALKDEITRGGQYSQMGNFLNLFNKAACESQGIPYYSPRRFGQKIGASQENSDPIFPIQCEQVEDVKSKQPPEPVKPKDSSREEVEKQRKVSEIEDEERFLYGDDDVKPTSETLSDNRNQKPSQPDPVNTADKQEFDKIHDLLKTIGLDIGVAEIGKLAIRTQERLHGKKVTHQAKPSVTGLQCSVTSVVDSKPKPSASPSSAEEKKKVLSSATVKPDQSFKPIPVHNPEPTPTGPPPKVEIPKIPSAAPTKPLLPPVDLLQIPTYPPYSTTQMESGYNMPSHSYDPYSPYVAYPASSWQMYNQANQPPPSRMSVAPPSHMSMAPPSHMSMAPPSHMSMAPPSHMSMAPPSHMSGAPPSHMSGAPPSHMSGAPPSHMSGAPPSHMAGAPPSHMAGAPPSHMAGAPPSHMAGAPPSHMAGAPPSHMAGAPPSHMAGAPPSHMAGAPPSHMAGDRPSHMAGDRPSHMSGDRPSHMSGDRPSHMSGDRPSHMSGARPSHMSGARPSHMSGAPPSHMSGAPPSHMSGAPPSHMSGAPPSHMSGAPPSHMSGAPPSHMSGAPPSHMSGAPPSHMSVASTSAPGSTITHSNLCVIQTTDDDYKRKVPVPSKVPSPSSAPAESPQVGDSNAGQKNKKTEKIKVLEELESLRKQQNVRKQIVYRLNTNVEQLRVQQGILLRRKHREKDGHKNPLLEELNKTLKSAEKQMSNMRREIAAASKKEQQLTVVAQILGLNPTSMDESSAAADPPKIQETSVSSCAVASKGSDKELRIPSDAKPNADSKHSSGSHGKDSQHPSNKSTLSVEPKPKEALQKNSETRSSSSSSSFSSNGKSVGDSNSDSIASKSSSVSKPVPESKKSQPSDSPCEKPKSKSPRPSKPLDKPSEKSQTVDVSQLFHYFDSGDHWCEDCNSVCGKLQDFLCHMHAKKHNQTVNVSKRPWAKKTESETRPGTGLKGKVSVPLRGPEFLIPVNGFYCLLCEELFGDHIVVEEHLKAFAHNDKYKKYVEVNNTYEQKRLANRVAGLAAIQETERRLKMEQKRKLDKKNSEDMEDLKNKKVKKADEERQKPKTHNEVQPDKANTPDKPEKSQNPKKEKEEPVKIPTFGKFTWKIPESKAQVAAADSVSNDTAASPEKNKEESIKGGKQKGIDIKLLGKPPSSPGSTWTPFTSSSAITTPTTSPTSNATSQTKVKPNLPIPVLRKSSTAPISKPAPLNTFLSIKSPNTTPKPLPVVKSKPDSTLICDVITKPFGAEPPANTLKENAETSQQQLPDSPRVETVNTASAHQTDKKSNPAECSVTKPVNKRSPQQNKPPNQSPLGRNNSKGQNPNDTPVKKIENVKETKLGPSTLTENSYKKSSTKCEPQNSKTAGPTQVKGSAPAPKTAPVSSTQRPLLSSSSSPRLQSNPNVKDSQGASDGKLQQKPNTKTFAGAADTTSNSSKVIPKGIVVPNSITTNKPERTQPAVPKAVNKAAQKLPENKPTASPVPGAAPTPKQTPTVKHKPAYSNTVKLNRKFKSEPLTLPSSLFGQMPDMSCKDIKITPSVAQNSNVNTEEGIKKPTGTCQKPLSVTSDTKIDRAHLEEELDSYYKLLAAEEDIEDVTTSEDQDVAMEIPSVRSQDIAMEIPPAPLKAVISPKATLPDLSTSELYDVDMACEEAPEAPGGPECAATSFSGLLASRTGAFAHRTQKTPIAATKTFVVAGAEDNVALKNDQGQQVYSPTEYSMEDLSVLTTCDSD